MIKDNQSNLETLIKEIAKSFKYEIHSINLLTNNRAELFISILIISAVVTPTGDPVSLFVFTIPLYLLMEIIIFIFKKNKK